MARRKQNTAADDGQSRQPPRRKRALGSDDEVDSPYDEAERSPSKRTRAARDTAVQNGTRSEIEDVESGDETGAALTPNGRKRGRPRKLASGTEADKVESTPSGRRSRRIVETPVKTNGTGTPSRGGNLADRSARRKSARALIDRVVTGQTSDDEAGGGDIEKAIYETSDDESEGADEGDAEELGADRSDGEDDDEEGAAEDAAATPSKKPRGRPRGRPKKAATAKRGKSPTPPRDLPPHEHYFFQNKPGLTKTSSNNLASLDLLTHDEYFGIVRSQRDHHADDVQFLQALHAESFPQWNLELSQGFSICLYGYGSKRPLLRAFAEHLAARQQRRPHDRIVMVNGYVATITAREILTTLCAAVDPASKPPTASPAAMAQHLADLLSAPPRGAPPAATLTVVVNSIDAPPLRKPGVQPLLAQVAAHPRVRLVCSADTPDFPLLWDAAARAAFRFAFHDATTFAPFAAELDVVDDVHELLGRRARRVAGKDGVAFVLRSLPENAKSLFRLLVAEVLVAGEEDGAAAGGGAEDVGVEYRMVYGKAVEEFICSSEMAFRTLLKE